MCENYKNVRTVTIITEPEPERPHINLGIGEREVINVVTLSPKDISSIRIDANGRYEADFSLRGELGLHGRYTYIFVEPVTCSVDGKTLNCAKERSVR